MEVLNKSLKQHKIISSAWFAFSASSTFCIFLLCYCNYSVIINAFTSSNLVDGRIVDRIAFPFNGTVSSPVPDHSPDECDSRYIYVHNLPSRFNVDLLEDCRLLNRWSDMCKYMENAGLGPHIAGSDGWFSTNQFSLEVIFHNRMKRYKCLTNDSTQASAIFVPYYAGLDIGRFLWDDNTTTRDALALDLLGWLRRKPEWKYMLGKDHFLVAGRITWDFRRVSENSSDWGSKLLFLPELKNMTSLVIESSPWYSNEVAIPYPTYFHPSTRNEVQKWQRRIRRQPRPYLFSFAGAPRPQMSDSIRNQIISQCLDSSSSSQAKCKLLRCDKSKTSKSCDQPSSLMNLFRSSVFCLQPPGDSYTRRSAFDSILAGCIPVFFHPGSAYIQYIWHLPRNYTKYSVFIHMEYVKSGNVSIQKKLSAIPKEEVEAMREEVIRLIPSIVYANPLANASEPSFEDAFDIAVNEFLNRLEVSRKEIKKGRDSNSGSDEELAWKQRLFGGVENHEWDSYFSEPLKRGS